MAIEDNYPGQSSSLIAPSERWADLTPSDTDDFPFLPKAIHNSSETPGSFEAVGTDGVAATFYLAAGGVLPIRPKRINATNLTAGMTFTGLK